MADHVTSNEELARLREFDRLKDTFVSLVSHELRTPLCVMMGYLLLGLEELGAEGNPQAREFFEKARVKAEQVSRIVQELTDFARLQNGQPVEVDDPLPLQQALHQVIELLNPQFTARALQLEVNVPLELQTQRYDGERLIVIFRNILSNAGKFSPEGGRIWIEGERLAPDLFALTVNDEAPPIPAEKREIIFEDFRQLENYLTRRYEGLGLGLAVARRTARALGGDLSLRVRDDGNTFVFTLPFNPAG